MPALSPHAARISFRIFFCFRRVSVGMVGNSAGDACRVHENRYPSYCRQKWTAEKIGTLAAKPPKEREIRSKSSIQDMDLYLYLALASSGNRDPGGIYH